MAKNDFPHNGYNFYTLQCGPPAHPPPSTMPIVFSHAHQSHYADRPTTFGTNYLTTELAHSKLKYGLFGRVISCYDSWAQKLSEFLLKMCPVNGHKRL